MADLVRYQGDAVERHLGSVFAPARPQKQLVRQMQNAAGQALVAATRVQGRAYVAQTGLAHLQMLERLEEAAVARNPMNEARYRRIVDAFAFGVEAEVLRLSL
jgi:hypothetical protein